VAAIVGDQIAYAIGRRSGEALFRAKDSRWFKQEHLQAAQDFYEKHGGKTIILARFMPFARTFAPVVAGAAKMRYPTFVFYNVIGGLLWIWSMLLTGYYVVKLVPGLEHHVEKLIIGIILLSIAPGIYGWWKSRQPKTT
jgi:membrane-associated protein